MLKRSKEWLIFALSLFSYASNTTAAFIIGCLLAETVGIIAPEPSSLPSTWEDFWRLPTQQDWEELGSVLRELYILIGCLMMIISPFYVWRTQFAGKNASAATELEEECCEGSLLPSSVKDLEGENCESASTTKKSRAL
jgi:hypothetical protein